MEEHVRHLDNAYTVDSSEPLMQPMQASYPFLKEFFFYCLKMP